MLLPYKTALSDEGDNPDMVANLFNDMFLSAHNSTIRFMIASVVFITFHPVYYYLIIFYIIILDNIGDI